MKTIEASLEIGCDTTGFSSPAETYVDRRLDPKDLLMPNPTHTFFLRASGNAHDVSDGDIMVVDRSIEPRPGDKVVVVNSGRLELKIYKGESEIWGVMTFSIKKHRQ